MRGRDRAARGGDVGVRIRSAAANAAIDPEVLAAREAAWRAYFGGDVKALGDLLPQEFIGIGMNDGSLRGPRQDPRRRASVS